MHKNLAKADESDSITPTYASRLLDHPLPKYELPQSGVESEIIYQVIKDELQLDGNAHMNLATFVTTWMEPNAAKLMSETFEKNLIDRDEYPQTAEIEKRCVNILAKLWNAPPGNAFGTSTVGSSEACMLAGMALKWRWRAAHEASGNGATAKPNLVLGANAQICWEKFCRYWEVEPRFVPVNEGQFHIDVNVAVEKCDENTIGVVGIMGSTLDGSYEPIQELSGALDKLQADTGLDIPIHVDAASGGFVAPFLQPELVWDFRLLRVKSINASGHKYGMVYPGVGWVLWRHPDDLPNDLIFNVNYLGGNEPTFALNFSRPGNGVIAQYYNFLRLGREGYYRILKECQNNAKYVSHKIAEMGPFDLISHGSDIPVLAFTLKKDVDNFSLYDLSDAMRGQGWQVPAYTMPANLEAKVVMRIVVKENFSSDMGDLFIQNLQQQVLKLMNNRASNADKSRNSFHH
jgi:glutamate decarboxylase